MTYTIVGVTGHIDHGKTTLVRVLSGVDTDTDPEEKRRGITIDLGFASLQIQEHRFALIDAPGHQKYIGNLLAGVSAIDIGLLIVASDQGIQEQTLEHAAVIRALGIRNLIVAVSRIDLVDDKAVSQLSEELELFLAEIGFDEIPIVPISSVTGAGIDRLKDLLCEYAIRCDQYDQISTQSITPDFRMPIDRVFRVEGRGLVVAGTIWSGQVRIGDMLELAGTKEQMRVRELQVHGSMVDHSSFGFRTAINLASLGGMHVERGNELVTPGTHPKCEQLVVALDMFPDAAELRLPATVQMHLATQCCTARIIGVKQLRKNERQIVVVQPEHPVVATFQQALLFRCPYPVGSFAGGRVLAALGLTRGKTKQLLELGGRLRGSSAMERLKAWIDYSGELEPSGEWFEVQVGISKEKLKETVQSLVSQDLVHQIGRRLISMATLDTAKSSILHFMQRKVQNSESAWLSEQSIVDQAKDIGSPDLIQWTLNQLIETNVLVRLNKMIAISSDQTNISKKQRHNMDQILLVFQDNRSPPTLKEAGDQLKLSLETVTSLVRFATQQQVLLNLDQGLFMAIQTFVTLCRELRALFQTQPELSVSSIRDHWQVTRKHAIPLLEYCDREAITIRKDNVRTAGPRLEHYCKWEHAMEHSIEQV